MVITPRVLNKRWNYITWLKVQMTISWINIWHSTNHSSNYLSINAFFHIVFKYLQSWAAGKYSSPLFTMSTVAARSAYTWSTWQSTVKCQLSLCSTVLSFYICHRWYFKLSNLPMRIDNIQGVPRSMLTDRVVSLFVDQQNSRSHCGVEVLLVTLPQSVNL
jgi:hypothetical protein